MVLLAATLIYGCEKSDRNEEDSDTGNDTGTGWNDEIVPDTVFKGFLTVEEAATAEVGSLINVRGYIVGSTSRNIYNAIVRPPFESRTSLILADKRLTEVEAFYGRSTFSPYASPTTKTPKERSIWWIILNIGTKGYIYSAKNVHTWECLDWKK